MSHQIDTQIYTLPFTAGTDNNPIRPYATITVGVPFTVKKVVFKPINCYFTTENAVGTNPFNPFLVYCDLISPSKAIGYSGHISNATGGALGTAGQWIAVNNDITFTLRSFINATNLPITFWLGSSLNGGNTFANCPFTGVITITVEYHSEL